MPPRGGGLGERRLNSAFTCDRHQPVDGMNAAASRSIGVRRSFKYVQLHAWRARFPSEHASFQWKSARSRWKCRHFHCRLATLPSNPAAFHEKCTTSCFNQVQQGFDVQYFRASPAGLPSKPAHFHWKDAGLEWKCADFHGWPASPDGKAVCLTPSDAGLHAARGGCESDAGPLRTDRPPVPAKRSA